MYREFYDEYRRAIHGLKARLLRPALCRFFRASKCAAPRVYSALAGLMRGSQVYYEEFQLSEARKRVCVCV